MLEPNPQDVQVMFSRLAPAYDRFNFLSSLGLDAWWRRQTVRRVKPGQSVLDLGCGTGDLTLAAWKRAAPSGRVIGVDFSAPMLDQARAKAQREIQPGPPLAPTSRAAPGVSFVQASADALPFASSEFDVVVSAFVLRSLAAIRESAAREIHRVLKPGGLACLLELSRPRLPLLRELHQKYLKIMIPFVGRLAAGSLWPRGYLASTILEFPEPETYQAWFTSVGMTCESIERLSGGITSLLVIRKV